MTSIITNREFQCDTEKLRKIREIGSLHTDECNDQLEALQIAQNFLYFPDVLTLEHTDAHKSTRILKYLFWLSVSGGLSHAGLPEKCITFAF